MITQTKIDKALILLKKAEKLALKYNPNDGFFLAFSGGKDSQCIYHLAKLAGVKFRAYYSVTSIDPPELMRFIKMYYSDVVWIRPKLTYFQLIRKKRALPNRKTRFCCHELKEKGGEGQVTITGVRRAESVKRSKRNSVELSNYQFSGTIDEFNAVYHTNDEGIEHRCIKGKDKIIINPIIDWSDNEVWSFIRNYLKIPYCSLYDKGFSRLGCICCPMGTKKEKIKQLQLYPNVKNSYIRAIQFISKYHSDVIWCHNADEILEWYISGKSVKSWLSEKKQLNFNFDEN